MSKFELTRFTTTWTWGKPPPSPFIVYFVAAHEAHIQMTFCLGAPIAKVGTLATLGCHNFGCKPLIEMRFKGDDDHLTLTII
jgi:hypothetical protein